VLEAILIFVFFAAPIASILVICNGLALWLAFGKTNIFYRMPLFLLGTLFPGFLFALVESSQSGLLILLLVSAVSILIVLTSRLSFVMRTAGTIFFSGILTFVVAGEIRNWNELHSAWIVKTSLGTGLVAAFFSALRLAKINVIQLASGTNDLEVESRTGRGLDGWIKALNQSDAYQWSYAEIMAFLRGYGIEFSWQKKITQAYERSLGRSPVSMSPIGSLQVVEQGNLGTTTGAISGTNLRGNQRVPWLQRIPLDQIGIWQWMLITFCVACLFRFTSAFSSHLPTGREFAIGIPLFTGFGLLTFSLVASCLAIGQVRRRPLILTFGGLGLLLGLLYGAEECFGFSISTLRSRWSLASIAFLFLSTFIIIMMAVLTLARHREYRVVKVNRIPRPVDPTIGSLEQWETLRDQAKINELNYQIDS
jgi:hypothetical protein